MSAERLKELLELYVREDVLHGNQPDPETLCEDCPELIEPLREQIRRYERLEETFALPADSTPAAATAENRQALPTFEGFRTIERLGAGGGGEVYKLEDVELGRTVAAKVIRAGSGLPADVESFLREARALALFEDPRIVTIYEFRRNADPPVLLMEYVEGFELGRIGRSLEYRQRATIVAQIAEAIDHAHRLGIQHRDLKPANVMLDAQLNPRILDFGLSRGEADLGHGIGTPSYMAPEQLDPRLPIDERTDVYALGVVLYELLCGAVPYVGRTAEELQREIDRGAPRLPREIEPEVPEALQAIALKAIERDSSARYRTAQELALDLRRYVEGQPVTARSSHHQTALDRRVRPHLAEIREWLRVRLIHPHEAERLHEAYAALEASEDDWIVSSRSLTLSQIALYLGAFLLVGGSLLYLNAYFLEAVSGVLGPLLMLGLPFVGLSVAAERLYRRNRKAVAVAFHLGAVLLLPLFLVIVLNEAGLWRVAPDDTRELFGEGFSSNRQMQFATLVACLWAGRLALSTRTVTLGACFTGLLLAFALALLGDFGLRTWLEDSDWHLLALHLAPWVLLLGSLGYVAERRDRSWLARPLYVTGAALFVVVLELLALNGKLFEFLALSMSPFQAPDVSDPTLLDTMTAMTVNGAVIYLAGWLLEHRGSPLMKRLSWLLYVISPFAILYPLSHLVGVGEYSLRYDWFYLALSLGITLVSHFRQRRSFYFAGLLNTGLALWFISDHHEWFDRPAWAVAVLATGLVLLVTGFLLHLRERRRGG